SAAVRTVHQAQQGRKGSSAAGRSGRDDVGRYERAPGGQHARRAEPGQLLECGPARRGGRPPVPRARDSPGPRARRPGTRGESLVSSSITQPSVGCKLSEKVAMDDSNVAIRLKGNPPMKLGYHSITWGQGVVGDPSGVTSI